MEGLRVPMVQHMQAHTDVWDDWPSVIAWAGADHRALYEAIAGERSGRGRGGDPPPPAFYAQAGPRADDEDRHELNASSCL